MTLTGWLALGLGLLAAAAVTLWLTRRARAVLRERFRRAARNAIHQFRTRLARYQLQQHRLAKDVLTRDATVAAAVRAHAAEHGLSEARVWRRVNEYIDEIVPHFNVLSYYKLGYNLAKIVLNLLYKVSVDYQDEAALERIPKHDVVIYLMNHRSNADYIVVAYVLAYGVQVSYAVGEWARVWPLEYVFKSFGAYFIRRRFREPLYHAVLERYVQLITRNSVTQGFFPEGRLSRDGRLGPPKLGLLDYICRTVHDPEFTRDIWFVPVGMNFDRVLEDRSLIRELIDERDRPGRLAQLGTVLSYVTGNLIRLLTGRLKRYGRAAVNFGTPLSLRHWLASAPADVLSWPKERRLPELQKLAEELLDRIGAIIPVTPVPLAAAALLSFEQTAIPKEALLERMDELRDRLLEANGKVVRGGARIGDIWDRAWRMLRMRRLVVVEGDTVVVLPRGRPLLEYYANSIAHLLPIRGPRLPFHKEHEAERDLPRLRTGGWGAGSGA
ncbi:MAG: 1-acyl-sn-glycerol-3-phosphate acyltransferase [Gemmatimonadetes bacterium]|nr:1-acyl-sn-glycerol-3-phosphate acyltransferase [Gemmatimonadota bacterium]